MLLHVDPARGAPVQDLIPATFVAFVALLALGILGVSHGRGHTRALSLATSWTTRVPSLRGLPSWASAPVGLTAVSLVTAVFGFYWDVSTHIDNGRDPGPFANPAHFFILAGLAGIAVAGYLAVVLRAGERPPVGGVLLLACGVIALAGFPLDDVWHRIFGQDVTLWGPTHIQMVAGASLATLASWVLYLEGTRVAPGTHRRGVELSLAGAFLVGLATLQAEFDFGVPQFRLLYQPVLLALAAGIGLVTARVRCGRGGALTAVVGFLVIRGGLALVVGPVLGRSVPHLPLFLVEALLVEAVASFVPSDRPLRLGALSGVAIGTIGFAAEWAWSHVWMPLPWKAGLLPEGVVIVPAAAVTGGVLGALIGSALAGQPVAVRASRVAAAFAGVVVVAALGWPLPTNAGGGIRAAVQVRDVRPAPARAVAATIRVDPPSAADDNDFFTVTAWQGAQWTRRHVVIDQLRRVGPGTWRTTTPIPVYGEWKAIVRLHKGRTLAATPIYLPADPGIPAAEVPASASFTRGFVRDKAILQREFTGGPGWLTAMAYAVLAGIAAAWIAIVAWGLGRFRMGASERDVVSPRPRAPARAA